MVVSEHTAHRVVIEVPIHRQGTYPVGRVTEPIVQYSHNCGEEPAQLANLQPEPQSDIGHPQPGLRRSGHTRNPYHL